HDRRQRQPKALRNAPDVDARHGGNLQKQGSHVSAPTEGGGDLEAHGGDGGNKAGDEAESKHQGNRLEGDRRGHREARDEIADLGFHGRGEQGGKGNAGNSTAERQQHGFAKHQAQDASAGKAQGLEHADLAGALT